MRTTRPALLVALGLLLCVPQLLPAQPGALDPTFNGTGYVVRPVNTGDGVQKVLVQPDQRILAIGMSWDATYTARAYVFRYNPDGTPDMDFATDGVFTYELDNEALFYSATLTPAGKILLVGSTTDYQTYRLLLVQLNADGSPDVSFGTDGVVTQSVSLVEANAEDMAYDVTLDADGNILVCGSSYDANYVRRPIVVRFTPTGELDTGFGVDGVATIPVMAVGASVFKGITVQPDGRIVATGSFGQTELWYLLLLVRFNADGTLDGTFSEDGIIRYNYGNVDDGGYDLKLTTDGSILVAGKTVTVDYDYSALLMKFTAEGEVDASFGTAGAVEEDLDNYDYGWELAVEADGDVLMAGTSGDGPPNGFDLAVWKYHADGTRDDGFGTNGLVQHTIPDYYTMIYGLALQADGRILIGGQARTTVNENYFFLARLENSPASSVADLAAPARVVVAPNPTVAGASIGLQVTGSLRTDARIGLYTADGRLVHAYRPTLFDRQADRTVLQLPADLAPGTYQLIVQQPGTRPVATMLITQ